MRYFLISFYYKDNYGNDGFSEGITVSEQFPSKESIVSIVKLNAPKVISVKVMNIFEFKNHRDYANYIYSDEENKQDDLIEKLSSIGIPIIED